MSGPTSIEWCDAVWNVFRGCSMAKGSETGGCLNCYAARDAVRFPWGDGYARRTPNGPRWTGRFDFLPDKLGWPLRYRGSTTAIVEQRPTRIFVNSTSDLFHESADFHDVAAVYGVMAYSPHEFIVLTKRPERRRAFYRWMSELSGPPIAAARDGRSGSVPMTTSTDPLMGATIAANHRGVTFPLEPVSRLPIPAWPLRNVIEGTSVEDQKTADARIPELLRTPAHRRLISYEPALGPVDFFAAGMKLDGKLDVASGERRFIHWMIIGGESALSRSKARPFDVEWVASTADQCSEARVALFVKQMGTNPGTYRDVNSLDGLPGFFPMALADKKGGDWSEWPERFRVREFPRMGA